MWEINKQIKIWPIMSQNKHFLQIKINKKNAIAILGHL